MGRKEEEGEMTWLLVAWGVVLAVLAWTVWTIIRSYSVEERLCTVRYGDIVVCEQAGVTVAFSEDGGRLAAGAALCCDRDRFDLDFGVRIARGLLAKAGPGELRFSRAAAKAHEFTLRRIAAKRVTRADVSLSRRVRAAWELFAQEAERRRA